MSRFYPLACAVRQATIGKASRRESKLFRIRLEREPKELLFFLSKVLHTVRLKDTWPECDGTLEVIDGNEDLAEGIGFEPTLRFPVILISSQAP